jgi:hypothetical protein
METGKIYYAKHIEPGLVNYGTKNILVGEDTLKRMDPTFKGRPVYLDHDEEVKSTVSEDAVGYVIRSFYNELDGCHWVQFIISEDAGERAIAAGYKVSNSYSNLEYDSFGGEWHNIHYDEEVLNGSYEHLALVQYPRYEDAIIFNEKQYAEYCESKRKQLETLKNSKILKKGDKTIMNEVEIGDEKMGVEELERRYKDVLIRLENLEAKLAVDSEGEKPSNGTDKNSAVDNIPSGDPMRPEKENDDGDDESSAGQNADDILRSIYEDILEGRIANIERTLREYFRGDALSNSRCSGHGGGKESKLCDARMKSFMNSSNSSEFITSDVKFTRGAELFSRNNCKL